MSIAPVRGMVSHAANVTASSELRAAALAATRETGSTHRAFQQVIADVPMTTVPSEGQIVHIGPKTPHGTRLKIEQAFRQANPGLQEAELAVQQLRPGGVFRRPEALIMPMHVQDASGGWKLLEKTPRLQAADAGRTVELGTSTRTISVPHGEQIDGVGSFSRFARVDPADIPDSTSLRSPGRVVDLGNVD